MAFKLNSIPNLIKESAKAPFDFFRNREAKKDLKRAGLSADELKEMDDKISASKSNIKTQIKTLTKQLNEIESNPSNENNPSSTSNSSDDIDDDVFGNEDVGVDYQIAILKSQIESKKQTLKNPEKILTDKIDTAIIYLSSIFDKKFANSNLDKAVINPLVQNKCKELFPIWQDSNELQKQLKKFLGEYKTQLKQNLQEEIALANRQLEAIKSLPGYFGMKTSQKLPEALTEKIQEIQQTIASKRERLTNIDKEIDHQAMQIARNESIKAQVEQNYKASPSPTGPAIASQKPDLNHNAILTLYNQAQGTGNDRTRKFTQSVVTPTSPSSEPQPSTPRTESIKKP